MSGVLVEQFGRWRPHPHAVAGGRVALEERAAAVRNGRPCGLVLPDATMPHFDIVLMDLQTPVMGGLAGNLGATGRFDAAGLLERAGAESRMDAAVAAWRRVSAEAALVIQALRTELSVGSSEVLCVP